jgi:hypothetical protein
MEQGMHIGQVINELNAVQNSKEENESHGINKFADIAKV